MLSCKMDDIAVIRGQAAILELFLDELVDLAEDGELTYGK